MLQACLFSRVAVQSKSLRTYLVYKDNKFLTHRITRMERDHQNQDGKWKKHIKAAGKTCQSGFGIIIRHKYIHFQSRNFQ